MHAWLLRGATFVRVGLNFKPKYMSLLSKNQRRQYCKFVQAHLNVRWWHMRLSSKIPRANSNIIDNNKNLTIFGITKIVVKSDKAEMVLIQLFTKECKPKRMQQSVSVLRTKTKAISNDKNSISLKNVICDPSK